MRLLVLWFVAFLAAFLLALMVAVGNCSAFSDLSTCSEIYLADTFWEFLYFKVVTLCWGGAEIFRFRNLQYCLDNLRITPQASVFSLESRQPWVLYIPFVCNLCTKNWQCRRQRTVFRRQSSDWLMVQDLRFEFFFFWAPAIATLAFCVAWKE